MSDSVDLARSTAVSEALGHTFDNQSLLMRACTHASRVGAQSSAESRLRDANERLEFLGDALFGAALCLALYQRWPEASEGQLSRMKARLASRATLAQIMDRNGLLAHCLVGPQMTHPWPESVKANVMESLFAAIYLDGGWMALVTAVDRAYGELLTELDADREDDKTKLQAWCLEHHRTLPTYASQRSGGSDHNPEFTATVSIGEHSASGSAGSRRRAEAVAAGKLLVQLKG
jgi:ribonuclease III